MLAAAVARVAAADAELAEAERMRGQQEAGAQSKLRAEQAAANAKDVSLSVWAWASVLASEVVKAAAPRLPSSADGEAPTTASDAALYESEAVGHGVTQRGGPRLWAAAVGGFAPTETRSGREARPAALGAGQPAALRGTAAVLVRLGAAAWATVTGGKLGGAAGTTATFGAAAVAAAILTYTAGPAITLSAAAAAAAAVAAAESLAAQDQLETVGRLEARVALLSAEPAPAPKLSRGRAVVLVPDAPPEPVPSAAVEPVRLPGGLAAFGGGVVLALLPAFALIALSTGLHMGGPMDLIDPLPSPRAATAPATPRADEGEAPAAQATVAPLAEETPLRQAAVQEWAGGTQAEAVEQARVSSDEPQTPPSQLSAAAPL